MLLSSQIIYAERRARVSGGALTLTVASEVTREYINKGVMEFAKAVNGIPKEAYLTLSPRFDSPANFAIRLTITGGGNAYAVGDVCTTATVARNDVTGATMAVILKEALSANAFLSCTVTWSLASWVFTINPQDALTTAIEIEPPTSFQYINHCPMLFNTEGTQASAIWVGEIPLDCTVETDLPDDFLEIEFVEWDGSKLGPAPYDLFISPSGNGTPNCYTVKGRKIRLAPAPISQKSFHIRYRHMPDDLEVDGTDDAVDCPLPLECHWAPIYYASALLAEEQLDEETAKREMGMFWDEVNKYRLRLANQTPTLFPRKTNWQAIRVDIDEA